MTRFLLIISLISFSSIANAQASSSKYAVCKMLPDAQNVVYQAGVDVNGNPVTPANLSSTPAVGTMDIVKIPLEFNLAQRISGLNLDGQLGMMEIHQDGKIMYQGQDISKPVMTLCGKSFKEVTVNEIMVPKEEAASMVAPAETEEFATTIDTDEVQKLRQEIESLKTELAVQSAEEAREIPEVSPPTKPQMAMPAVKAPSVEMLDEVTPTKERMANMDRPKISPPADPKKPLIGIPRATPKEPDVIKGQDYRDYNE